MLREEANKVLTRDSRRGKERREKKKKKVTGLWFFPKNFFVGIQLNERELHIKDHPFFGPITSSKQIDFGSFLDIFSLETKEREKVIELGGERQREPKTKKKKKKIKNQEGKKVRKLSSDRSKTFSITLELNFCNERVKTWPKKCLMRGLEKSRIFKSKTY